MLLISSSETLFVRPRPNSTTFALLLSSWGLPLFRMLSQEEVKARERAAARRNFMERARKAEVHRELCDMENKRRQSQRRAMLVREAKGKDAAAKNIQVNYPMEVITRRFRLFGDIPSVV